MPKINMWKQYNNDDNDDNEKNGDTERGRVGRLTASSITLTLDFISFQHSRVI